MGNIEAVIYVCDIFYIHSLFRTKRHWYILHMHAVNAPTSQSPRCTHHDKQANAQCHPRLHSTHTKSKNVEEFLGKIIYLF